MGRARHRHDAISVTEPFRHDAGGYVADDEPSCGENPGREVGPQVSPGDALQWGRPPGHALRAGSTIRQETVA